MKGNIICKNCGEENLPNKKFCGECGNILPVIEKTTKTKEQEIVLPEETETYPNTAITFNKKKISIILSVIFVISVITTASVLIGRDAYFQSLTGEFQISEFAVTDNIVQSTLSVTLYATGSLIIQEINLKYTMNHTYSPNNYSVTVFEGKSKYSINNVSFTIELFHLITTPTWFYFSFTFIRHSKDISYFYNPI